jgi:hypothetical protein
LSLRLFEPLFEHLNVPSLADIGYAQLMTEWSRRIVAAWMFLAAGLEGFNSDSIEIAHFAYHG